MRHSRVGFIILLGFLALAAGPAAADWIVTTDGERIETQGPWEVRGRLVVMTLADGELASMRLSNVDLDASRRATDEAAGDVESPPADEQTAEDPEPRVKIVLTDSDFTTVRRPLPGSEGEEESTESSENTPSNAPTLAVITSESSEDPATGGTVVSGVLGNQSNRAVANVTLTVRLYDVSDEILEESEAALSSPSLSPGGRASFRAVFPDVLAFARLELEPRGVELLTEGSEEGVGESDSFPDAFPDEEEDQDR